MAIVTAKHVAHGKLILALSDAELMGTCITQKEVQLDLTKQFFQGKVLDTKTLLGLIKSASSITIVGKESITYAIKNELVDKSAIKTVNDIPYAFVTVEG